jgi:hypothetical protein
MTTEPHNPGASGFLLHDTEPAEVVHGVRACRRRRGRSLSTSGAPGNRDSLGNYGRAVLCNGLSRYDDAVVAARQATEYPEDLGFFSWGSVEVIEAAAQAGATVVATSARG